MAPAAPLPPGRSPFHVRGSTYVGIRESIDARLPGGLAAVLVHLPDSAHRDFASQTFLPVTMYDALPIRALTEAIAMVEGVPYSTSVSSRARLVAQRDVAGLYRLLLRAVSPATAAERLQRAALRYFDFGTLSLREQSKGHCVFQQSGWPEILQPWFVAMLEGYAPVVLGAAGAESVAVSAGLPHIDGRRAGLDTVSFPISLSWT